MIIKYRSCGMEDEDRENSMDVRGEGVGVRAEMHETDKQLWNDDQEKWTEGSIIG